MERGGRDGREGAASVTTAVRLNDRLGRCYFCFIKPFHRMIVPAVVKRSLHRLESEVRAGSADGERMAIDGPGRSAIRSATVRPLAARKLSFRFREERFFGPAGAKSIPPRTIAGRMVFPSGAGRGYFSVPSCACWIIWSLAVMSISTRRFCARPSSVELSAIGES